MPACNSAGLAPDLVKVLAPVVDTSSQRPGDTIMRYIAFYLIIIAIFALAVSSMTGALAADVTCELGTYGAIVEGCPR